MSKTIPNKPASAFHWLDIRVLYLHPAHLSQADVASALAVSGGHVSQVIKPVASLRNAAPEAIEAKLHDLFAQELGVPELGRDSENWKRWFGQSRKIAETRAAGIEAARKLMDEQLADLDDGLKHGERQRGRRKKVLDVPAEVA